MKIMKKIRLFLSLVAIGILFSACGSGTTATKESARKLKNYSTYAFLPNKDTITSRNYENDQIHELVIETVNKNMKDKGYALDMRNPDVLVYVHTMFDEKVDVNADPVYTSYSYYRPGHYVGPYYEPYTYENYFTIQRLNGDDIQQVPYRERSVVIDVIDRRTNNILWRGATTEEIGTRRLEREIRENIDEIFKTFP